MTLELNKIYTGDCWQLLANKILFPNTSVDLILTDPPYEIEAHTMQRRCRRGHGLKNEALPFEPMTEELRESVAYDMARIAQRWVLVFCQIEASQIWRKSFERNGLIYKRTMIWVKPDGMPQYTGDRPGMGYETILAMHTPGRSEWNGGGRHGVFIQNKNENGGEPNDHPTQKPVRLMQTLCRLFGIDGGVVLDPFCGSGTTLVAALQKESPYIGIEINPDYVKIAEARIASERAQLKLNLT